MFFLISDLHKIRKNKCDKNIHVDFETSKLIHNFIDHNMLLVCGNSSRILFEECHQVPPFIYNTFKQFLEWNDIEKIKQNKRNELNLEIIFGEKV